MSGSYVAAPRLRPAGYAEGRGDGVRLTQDDGEDADGWTASGSSGPNPTQFESPAAAQANGTATGAAVLVVEARDPTEGAGASLPKGPDPVRA